MLDVFTIIANTLMASVGLFIIVLMAVSVYRIKTTSENLTERTTNFNVLYLQLAMIVIAFIAVIGSFICQIWIDIKYREETEKNDTAWDIRHVEIKAAEALLIFFVAAILLYSFGLYQRTDLRKEDLIQDTKSSNLSSKSRVNLSSNQSSPMNSFGSKPSNNSLIEREPSGVGPIGSDSEVRE